MQFIVAKGEKRARDGKKTTFFRGITEVSTQKTENYKRRKLQLDNVSPNVGSLLSKQRICFLLIIYTGTPPRITYHTPCHTSESPSPEVFNSPRPRKIPSNYEEEFHSRPSYPGLPSAQISDTSIWQDISTGSFDFESKIITATAKYLVDPLIPMLERFVFDTNQAWSECQVAHHTGHRDATLEQHKRLVTELPELPEPHVLLGKRLRRMRRPPSALLHRQSIFGSTQYSC